MKTAQEILDQYGCPEIPFDENVTMFYPAIIEAIEEYASQFSNDLLLCHKCGCNKLHYEGNDVFKCLNIECDNVIKNPIGRMDENGIKIYDGDKIKFKYQNGFIEMDGEGTVFYHDLECAYFVGTPNGRKRIAHLNHIQVIK